jgi:hypothetical protein
MCEQLGGLGRSGGPFLKIVTGAGEQSIAASSIAGFRKAACQIGFWVVGYFEFPDKPTHIKNAVTAVANTVTRNAKVPIAMPIQ